MFYSVDNSTLENWGIVFDKDSGNCAIGIATSIGVLPVIVFQSLEILSQWLGTIKEYEKETIGNLNKDLPQWILDLEQQIKDKDKEQ